MAKELPYFKFEPNQWENGNIQMLSREDKGLFVDLCSMYWSRLGDFPLKLAVQKLCAGNATALNSLIHDDIFTVKEGFVCIDFLNEQLLEFENTSQQNSKNAKEGWEKRRFTKDECDRIATASIPQCENDAIREDKIRKDKINNILLSEIKISSDKNFFLFSDFEIPASEEEIKYFTIAIQFQKLIVKNLNDKKSPYSKQENAIYKEWVTPIRLIFEKNEATKEQLLEAYNYLNSPDGEFWKSNILSTNKLREKLPTLIAKKNTKNTFDAKKEALVPNPNKRGKF